MMKINHMGFGVSDVVGTANMFETYFGFQRMSGPFNAKMAFLTDENGALITMFKIDDATYPELFHIGFMLGEIEQVTAIHERLVADGFAPGEPREEFGRYTFYFNAPGGFVVEVNSPVKQTLRDAVSVN